MKLSAFIDGDNTSFDLKELSLLGTIVSYETGEAIVNQYARSQYLYLLKEGSVSFSIKIKDEPEELEVGLSTDKYTPIGWSGFKEPFRYATSVKAVRPSILIRFEFKELYRLFQSKPQLGKAFLCSIGRKANGLLLQTKSLLANLLPPSQQSFLELNSYDTVENDAQINVIQVLQRSPFFEVFNEKDLKNLVTCVEVKEVKRGEKHFKQGEAIESISILMQGRMALIHSLDQENKQLDKRIISSEGYLLSIEGSLKESDHTETCIALKASTVLSIGLGELSELFKISPELAYTFYKRILWYISVRLRSARAKLIRINYDGEISAVKHIIEQHATQLNVLSEIHKIPTLLSNTITLKDAIATLEDLQKKGNSLEKRLATNSLNVLTEVVRENDFYRGLASIYASIADAPSIFTPEEVRNLCAESFCSLFDKVGFHLTGIDNLAKEPAIYIYNHLENHVYNTLPNNFQLTLDSHFISSVILYRELGNPGIRVVRVPKGEEYGHQLYYEKLGHIPVYTQDSEQLSDTEKRKRRAEFYETAAEYLNNGTSILLAPEGRSFTTEQSPGDFKAGAFILASKLKKEPLIVPIAVANFDKRLNRTTYSASIQKPFKLSERVQDPSNRFEMNAFLQELKENYKSYIQSASQVSNETAWSHLL